MHVRADKLVTYNPLSLQRMFPKEHGPEQIISSPSGVILLTMGGVYALLLAPYYRGKYPTSFERKPLSRLGPRQMTRDQGYSHDWSVLTGWLLT